MGGGCVWWGTGNGVMGGGTGNVRVLGDGRLVDGGLKAALDGRPWPVYGPKGPSS